MKILDRYILAELLIPLIYCLIGGIFFFLTFDLFANMDDFQEHNVPLSGIVTYVMARLPELITLILPAALLLSLLYAITNHARYNEIVAMRTAGISVWRIASPYLVIALILGAIVFYLNENCVSEGTRLAQNIKKGRKNLNAKVFEQINFTNAKSQRSWNIGAYHSDDDSMEHLSVEWIDSKKSTIKLLAEEAFWKSGQWEFHNVHIFTYEEEGFGSMIPSPEQYEVYTSNDIDETPEAIRCEIFISSQDSLKDSKRAHLNLSEINLYLRLHQGIDNNQISKIKTLFHSRIASPFTCIVVVLIALPFGLQSNRRNIFVGVASSIVICFTFFILGEVSLALGSGKLLPPLLSAWLPNIVFSVGGILAIKKLA